MGLLCWLFFYRLNIILEYSSKIIEQECCFTGILFHKNSASQNVPFSHRWAQNLTWSWTRCSRLWSEFRRQPVRQQKSCLPLTPSSVFQMIEVISPMPDL